MNKIDKDNKLFANWKTSQSATIEKWAEENGVTIQNIKLSDIYAGKTAVCLSNDTVNLTEGKEYKILESRAPDRENSDLAEYVCELLSGGEFLVVDDSGDKLFVHRSYFKVENEPFTGFAKMTTDV